MDVDNVHTCRQNTPYIENGFKKLGMLVNPVVKRQRQADPWGSLVSQPNLRTSRQSPGLEKLGRCHLSNDTCHMYMHGHRNTHTYTCTHRHAYMHTYICRKCAHTRTHIYIHTCTLTHRHTHGYACMHACIHTHSHAHTGIHIDMHAYTYMHMHTHTHPPHTPDVRPRCAFS